jgi:hypothetical protein
MINRLTAATLAIFLIVGGGALALAISGSPSNGSAAITQYESVPPVPPTTPPGGGPAPNYENHGGVEGTHESGGKPKHEGGGPQQGGGGPGSSGGGPGGNSGHSGKPESVQTAFTGPASAAGTLPFTGSDVLALAAIGLLLLLAGVAQRRFASHRRE